MDRSFRYPKRYACERRELPEAFGVWREGGQSGLGDGEEPVWGVTFLLTPTDVGRLRVAQKLFQVRTETAAQVSVDEHGAIRIRMPAQPCHQTNCARDVQAERLALYDAERVCRARDSLARHLSGMVRASVGYQHVLADAGAVQLAENVGDTLCFVLSRDDAEGHGRSLLR
ncbi:MAG: hypothetical protein OWQ59_05170 [Alicyclobacillaceae bacterium]|nr:hypothetical protein [Alicyclobacillaceae bacterium]